MEKTNGNILDQKVVYSSYKISSGIIKIFELIANLNLDILLTKIYDTFLKECKKI